MSVFFSFSFALLNIVKLDLPKLAVVLEARLTDLFSVRVLFKVVVRGQFFLYIQAYTEHRILAKEAPSVAHLTRWAT